MLRSDHRGTVCAVLPALVLHIKHPAEDQTIPEIEDASSLNICRRAHVRLRARGLRWIEHTSVIPKADRLCPRRAADNEGP